MSQRRIPAVFMRGGTSRAIVFHAGDLPEEAADLRGETVRAEDCDILSRVVSMGKTHRAYAPTASMCLAVAAQVPGTLVHEAARPSGGDLRLGHPSGVLRVGAAVSDPPGGPRAEKAIACRTARRLMEGAICVPSSLFPEAASA